MNKSSKKSRPISLAPLTPEQALRIALNTPLPEKARKRQERKKAAGKKKG